MERSVFLTAVNDLSEGGNFYRTVMVGIEPLDNNLSIANNEQEKLNLWGITEKSTTTFKNIEVGSIILFYNKGSIVGYSKVKSKLTNKELSVQLWGSFIHGVFKEQCYWSNILILSEFCPVKMDFSEIIKLGNYNPKFSIRRILKLNGIAVTNILKKHDHLEEFFNLFKIQTKIKS